MFEDQGGVKRGPGFDSHFEIIVSVCERACETIAERLLIGFD